MSDSIITGQCFVAEPLVLNVPAPDFSADLLTLKLLIFLVIERNLCIVGVDAHEEYHSSFVSRAKKLTSRT